MRYCCSLLACLLSIECASSFTARLPRQPRHQLFPRLSAVALREGLLVEAKDKNGNLFVAAVTGPCPKTKKNWACVDGVGVARSIAPKAVTFVVPDAFASSPVSEAATLTSFADSAVANPDAAATLEVAWEMALEDSESDEGGGGGGMALIDLSELLIDSPDSPATDAYATFALLERHPAGKCYFKRLPGGDAEPPRYAPRGVLDAQRLLSVLAAEAEAAALTEALRARVMGFAASRQGGAAFEVSVEDGSTVRAFEAVKRLGCYANFVPSSSDKGASSDVAAERERVAAEKEGKASDALARSFLKDTLQLKATPESARTLLVSLGIWDEFEELDVIRLRTPTEFVPALVLEAEQLVLNPPTDVDADRRLDLTHLRSFAIDDASTKEVDDAVSFEYVDDPFGGEVKLKRVWIHVADPTRYIALGSPIEQEARRRKSTIYFPTGAVPMLPHPLAVDLCSLRAPTPDEPDLVNCALSIGCLLRDAAGEVEDGELLVEEVVVTPSFVSVERLTYDQVDNILSARGESNNADASADDADAAGGSSSLLSSLHAMAARRLKWRIEFGGSMEGKAPARLPDCDIVVTKNNKNEEGRGVEEGGGGGGGGGEGAGDGWKVSISAGGREDSPSRTLVSELMLLAGEAVGSIGEDNELPLPFRCQAARPPRAGFTFEDEAEEVASLPEGFCRTWKVIRGMGRSSVEAKPLPHEGLGLDAYVQVTSPIRRFADLCVHYQLKAFLRNSAQAGSGTNNDGQPTAFLPFSVGGQGGTVAEKESSGGDAGGAGTGGGGGEGGDILALARDTGDANFLQRASEARWVAEYFKRNAGALVEATALADPQSQRDDGEASTQKVLLHDLGLVSDFKGSPQLEVTGARVSVALAAAGHVTRVLSS